MTPMLQSPPPPLMKSFLIMFQTHTVFHHHVNPANPPYMSKEPSIDLLSASWDVLTFASSKPLPISTRSNSLSTV